MMPHINNNARSLTVLYVTNTVTELYGNLRAKKALQKLDRNNFFIVEVN